jgi:hypothetical protein
MLSSDSLCIVCDGVAIVALANAIIVLFGVQGTRRWITPVLVPCFPSCGPRLSYFFPCFSGKGGISYA